MEKIIELAKIRIAICDDMSEMNNTMSEILRDILDEKDIVYEISQFYSGKELLKQIEQIDLAFLDIEMPEMDGIETGEYIRRQNPRCKIIIASAREERMKETFRVNAMRFVSKPYDKEEIYEAVETYLVTFQLGMQKIEVFKNRKLYRICQREIQYIEAYNGTVNIVARNTIFRKEMTLNKIEEMLDKRIFFRIHKTYIVGLFYVKNYTENKVLIEEEQLPLSRRNRRDFERAFIDFDVIYRG